MPPKQVTSKREDSSRHDIDPSDLSDVARRRLVRSDAARKRAAYAFTNVGSPVPPKLLYHAVPEFELNDLLLKQAIAASLEDPVPIVSSDYE